MRLLKAFGGALIGPRRIDADEADQLLDHGFSSGVDPRLAALLRAASAPATVAELADEPTVIAAFVAARAADAAASSSISPRPSPAPRPSRRRWRGLRWATAVAATLALAFGGGTVYAASASSLPERLRQYAHHLFDPSGNSATQSPGVVPSAEPRPTSVAATASTAPDRTGLCRAWQAAQSGNGKAMGTGAARNLADLAGGADRIAAFCATAPSAQPSPPGHNKASPTRAAPTRTGFLKATPARVARRTRPHSGKAE